MKQIAEQLAKSPTKIEKKSLKGLLSKETCYGEDDMSDNDSIKSGHKRLSVGGGGMDKSSRFKPTVVDTKF